MHVGLCVGMCSRVQFPVGSEEGAVSPGAGVLRGFEPPAMSGGNQMWDPC